jgi:DNA-binding response OmpR family regulator
MSCLKPRPRILAVDDDSGVLESLGLILEERYDVLEARNGDTALKLIQSEPVDLVLLDVLIEGIDGITLLQQLRARGNDVPVIIISGLGNAWTAATAMRLGAVDYVTKPFEETELLRMIESTLRHHGAAAELRQAPRAPRILLIGFPVGLAAALTVALSGHASVESIPAGGNALALIPLVSPDILVLDVTSVPNPNEILGAVKTRIPLAPLIATSMLGRSEGDGLSAETGAHLVLQKPVSLRGLLNAITAELRLSVSLLPLFTPKVVDVMESVSVHFAAVTVHDLSRDLGKSPDHLSRLFYAETGMTLKAYLNRVQVEAARQLLLKTGDKIEVVAGQVGFHDASHLSRSFMKYLGQRPGDFHRTASEGPTRPRASSPPLS